MSPQAQKMTDRSPKMTHRTLITFDLDGVLIKNPFRKGVFPEVQRLLAYLVQKRDGLDFEAASQAVLNRIISEAAGRMRAGDIVEAYDWDGIINLVAGRLGYRENIRVDQLVEYFCGVEGMIGLWPHAVEALDFLSGKDFDLGVVTNGYCKYQYPVLEALGIARYFDLFVSPEQTGFGKPQREIFLAALTARQAVREAVWEADRETDREAAPETARTVSSPALHVGDSAVHDVFGARQAGFSTIWLCHNLPEHLLELSPRERVNHPDFTPVLAAAVAAEFCREAYEIPSLEDCRPDAVIAHMGEIPQAWDWQRFSGHRSPGADPDDPGRYGTPGDSSASFTYAIWPGQAGSRRRRS